MSERRQGGASPRRPALVLGARGMIVAWHGGLGPAVARFDSWSRQRPAFAMGLGHPGADRPATPALSASRGATWVAWCEQDGAWATRVGDDSEVRAEPRLAVPGAREVALAGATLFAADEEGVSSVELDDDGRPRTEPVRRAGERRAGPMVSATLLRDERLLLHAHRGARYFGVVALQGAQATAVRHRLPRACEDLHIQAIGSRAAFAVELEGGRVLFGLLGHGGRVIERPHPVFSSAREGLGSPQVVWTDDHWTVLARDRQAQRLCVQPIGGKGQAFVLPRADGPVAAAYLAQHLYALEVEPRGDEAELRLWRCARGGAGAQQRVARLILPDGPRRRFCLDARVVLARVKDGLISQRGYRGALRARPTLGPDGASLGLRDEGGRLSLRLRPRVEPTDAIELRVVHALGEGDELPEPPPSLVRLARWIAERLRPSVWQEREREREWGAEIAAGLEAEVERVERAGGTLLLDLVLSALPEPDVMVRWLRRLREEHVVRWGSPPASVAD